MSSQALMITYETMDWIRHGGRAMIFFRSIKPIKKGEMKNQKKGTLLW